MKALLNSLRRFSLTGVMVLAALWAGYLCRLHREALG